MNKKLVFSYVREISVIVFGIAIALLGDDFMQQYEREKISTELKINLLEEDIESICQSGLKLNEGLNKQEVVLVPRTQIKEGFFEKLFHFFK